MWLFPYGRPKQRIQDEKMEKICDLKLDFLYFAEKILCREKETDFSGLYTRMALIGKILRALFKEHGYPLKSYGNMGLNQPLYVAVSRI